ncbi:MAG: DNA-packaging protein [Clostridia bacterium]|nr:DNA-packaging protein [Clostridia bacterium]
MKEDAAKNKFLQALSESRGIIVYACKATGIARSTFYTWREQDEEFRRAVEDIMEAQIDFVEGKLLRRISAEETTAIIFYLKTKGKRRGYGEKQEDPERAVR